MNKNWVLFHLAVAHEDLGRLLADMQSNRRYEVDEYVVDIANVYHHLNTAWNARNATDTAAREWSNEDYYRWRQFPPEEEIYLGP